MICEEKDVFSLECWLLYLQVTTHYDYLDRLNFDEFRGYSNIEYSILTDSGTCNYYK